MKMMEQANPTWAAADIATNADGATSVFLIDLDKDGDIDILSSSYNDDTIAWYENNGAADPTFTAADIATNIDGAYHVYAEDMDADGDIDILASALLEIRLFYLRVMEQQIQHLLHLILLPALILQSV